MKNNFNVSAMKLFVFSGYKRKLRLLLFSVKYYILYDIHFIESAAYL